MPKSTGTQKAGRSARTILVLHGPNLNLLGTREPDIYGKETLEEINRRLLQAAKMGGAQLESFQSNHEGELIERVHAVIKQKNAFIIVNPGGFTHTSVALRDAFAAVAIPFIEVIYPIFKHASRSATIPISPISPPG